MKKIFYFPIHYIGFPVSITYFGALASSLNYIMASEYTLNSWPFPKVDKSVLENLKHCSATFQTVNEKLLDHIKAQSEKFPIDFPIQSIRLKELQSNYSRKILEGNIQSTYPLIHERTLVLICHFLDFKREYGTEIEKAIYKEMTVVDFVDRLLRKRSVMFIAAYDKYILLSGHKGHGGWKKIGTAEEQPPLLLKDCLSYDEMKIASMLFISGETVFINNGSRTNSGVTDTKNVEENGVIIGSIGARLKKVNYMEYEDIVISADQNTAANGYIDSSDSSNTAKAKWRSVWNDFFELKPVNFEQLKKATPDTRFVKLNDGSFFDNEAYGRRLLIPFDCALFEADHRGSSHGKMVFLNIIGIGLGVWKIAPHQNDIFLKTLIDRIKELTHNGHLSNIDTVNLSYISNNLTDIPREIPRRIGDENINISFENRNPHTKLIGRNENNLLVTIYPWDGNAHPGNEFWMGSLTGSGDPAAACSTQVAELHNAHINDIYVRGANLHVCGRYGVKHLSEYSKLIA